ncbi:MAG: hypothetical protein V2A72_04180 [Candidatus Omnitrophota bacterium]
MIKDSSIQNNADNKLEDTACLLCKSKDFSVLHRVSNAEFLESNEFQIVICKNCRFIYLNPRIKFEPCPRTELPAAKILLLNGLKLIMAVLSCGEMVLGCGGSITVVAEKLKRRR